MKISLKEINKMVDATIAEAKKKKKNKKEEKCEEVEVQPNAYSYAEALDFAPPLGSANLYRSQGAVNWGPMTGAGPAVDDLKREDGSVKAALSESAWEALDEKFNSDNYWQMALNEAGDPISFDTSAFGNVQYDKSKNMGSDVGDPYAARKNVPDQQKVIQITSSVQSLMDLIDQMIDSNSAPPNKIQSLTNLGNALEKAMRELK